MAIKLIENVTRSNPNLAQVDVFLSEGRIESIEPTGGATVTAEETLDGTGFVLLPGFVDSHLHLDKTLLGLDWFRNENGPDLTDRIRYERENLKKFGTDKEEQSSRLTELLVSLGTLYLRSHVDVDTDNGLGGVEALLTTRERYSAVCHIELGAFPQSGLVCRPGTFELMDEALRLGLDFVGGIDPASVDRDPRASVAAVFDLAEKHGKPVDIHLHELSELGGFSMELIIEQTVARGMQGLVTISHAFCLGSPNKAMVSKLVEGLAKARIAITTGGQPFSVVLPSIRQLLDAGVNVTTGNDGIRDMWGPYGTGDMLERIMFVAMRNYFRRDDELEYAATLAMENGAKLLGIEDYGVAKGHPADLLLVPGRNLPECIVTHPGGRIVFKAGRIVAKDGVYTG